LPSPGAGRFSCPREDRGIYTQGAFRGNNGVIGLALAASMYGDYGISLGAILAALVILFYNTLSTIVLAVYSPVIKSDPWSICKSVFSNPLIISVIAAAPFAYFKIGLPGWLETSGQYLAQNHPAAGIDLHWRHAVAGGDAQERQHGAQFKSGEDARPAGIGDAGRGCGAFAARSWGFCSCTSAARPRRPVSSWPGQRRAIMNWRRRSSC
jgi:hypothetical protein